MIFELLFNIFAFIIKAIFTITSILPDMPTVITNVGDLIADYATVGSGYLFEIVGKPFGVAILTIIIVVLPFYLTWRMSVWLYKMIRG